MDQLSSLTSMLGMTDSQASEVAKNLGDMLGVKIENVNSIDDLLAAISNLMSRNESAPVEPVSVATRTAPVEPVEIRPRQAATQPLQVAEEEIIKPGLLKMLTGGDKFYPEKLNDSMNLFDYYAHEDIYADAGFKAGLENLTPLYKEALLENSSLMMLNNKFTDALKNGVDSRQNGVDSTDVPDWVSKMLEICKKRPVLAYYFSRIPCLTESSLYPVCRHLQLTSRRTDSGFVYAVKDKMLLDIAVSIGTIIESRKHRCPEAIRTLTAAIS